MSTERIQQTLQALGKGDIGTAKEGFAEDAVLHAPGRNALAGDHEGREAIFDFFRRRQELAGGTFTMAPHALLADDEHAAVIATATAEREGKTLDAKTVMVFHHDAGVITEGWIVLYDVYAVDAFWA